MSGRSARRLGIPLAGVGLFCAAAASCIAVLDPDAYLEGEGPGATTASSTGSGGGGGGNACDADLQSDPEHCGACGWSCGPGVTTCTEGVCAPFSIVTSPTAALGVVDGKVLRVGAATPVQAIEIRDVAFDDGTPNSLAVAEFAFPSAKFARGGSIGGRFLVTTVSPKADPQSVLFCGLDGAACEERDLTGDVVAGVAPHSAALAGGDLYWALNSDDTRLRSVDAATCAGGTCALTFASDAWEAPDGAGGGGGGGGGGAMTPRPSSLRVQVVPDGAGGQRTSVWWTIHDFTEGSEATTCVHAWDVTSNASEPAPCIVQDAKIFTLVAAGPNVFYSTDVGGDGFIHRVVPDGPSWQSDKIDLSLEHPLEVDEELLYAYSGTNTDELVAARPTSATSFAVVRAGHVSLGENETPVHLDASDPDYFVFTTCAAAADVCRPGDDPTDQTWRLYRWRKPAPRPD